MRIESSSMTLLDYQSVYDVVGQMMQYAVKWIDKASYYAQNSYAAHLALIGANIVFFEVALSICRIAGDLLNKYEKYEDLQIHEQHRRSWILGLLFVSTIGEGIWVFSKTFRLPLSNWRVSVVSFSTSLLYLCYKS